MFEFYNLLILVFFFRTSVSFIAYFNSLSLSLFLYLCLLFFDLFFAAHNNLTSSEDLEHILKIPSLMTLDVQHNRINDVQILNILSQLPDLRVLYLMGNPVVKLIKYYRKTIIASCPNLKYLDDRPIFVDERRRVNRWKKVYDETNNYDKALEAERDEINLIRDEKRALEQENFRNFDKMVREGISERMKKEGSLECKDNSEENDENVDIENIENQNTGIVPFPENEELKAIREARLHKLMNPDESTSTSTKDSTSSSSFFVKGIDDKGETNEVNEFKKLLQQDIWPEFDQSTTTTIKKNGGIQKEEVPPPQTLMPPPPPPVVAAAPVLHHMPPAPPLSEVLMPPPPPPSANSIHQSLPQPPVVPLPGNTDFDELD